jgi:hypothetical protein
VVIPSVITTIATPPYISTATRTVSAVKVGHLDGWNLLGNHVPQVCCKRVHSGLDGRNANRQRVVHSSTKRELACSHQAKAKRT